jgi:hypothetical protein
MCRMKFAVKIKNQKKNRHNNRDSRYWEWNSERCVSSRDSERCVSSRDSGRSVSSRDLERCASSPVDS